ncbi:MAG: hypothetical protein H0V14_04170 [Chitinophagaceae bacterium]|nr:hypothetical protein [Chitinophagaceae bacterium]
MSLQNIQLSSIAISNLYNYYLVDINNDKNKTEPAQGENLFLGNNKKNILFIVTNIEVDFLTDNQLDFISGILSACKLNLADIAIINLNKIAKMELYKLLKASKIIAFGIKASAIGLPFSIADFQVQLFNNQTYLFAPELNLIQKETNLKRKLWVSLKEVFSIKN